MSATFEAVFATTVLEEVAERFHLELEPVATPDGRTLRLPFWRVTSLRHNGRPLADLGAIEALAARHGFSVDDGGIAITPARDAEERLRGLCTELMEHDPEAFFRLPSRDIQIPASGDLPESRAWLERYYGDGFTVREKKNVVFDLGRSQGPYLRSVDRDALQIIDAASQIATLPAGARPGLVQAALDEGRLDEHLLSAQDTRPQDATATAEFAKAVVALGSPRLKHLSLTNGGSEAIEKALHLARRYGGVMGGPGRRLGAPVGTRIVAFEGSFHGRTLLPLFSTWNEEKRAPYQLAGFETLWAPFPATAPGVDATFPSGWQAAWSDPKGPRDFTLDAPASGEDPEVDRTRLASELAALRVVESHLARGDVFALLLEPYQCEGGDRAATLRFFSAIRALTRAYGVPFVFDEVQSGFGLSGSFFWHRRFWLTDAHGQPDGPDLIAGAKRAQTGYVLSRWPDPYPTWAHSASVLRGRIHVDILEPAVTLAGIVADGLERLVQKYPRLVTHARAVGDAFAFDLPTPAIANHLIEQRFYRGLMVYIAGEKTLRYRLNRATGARDVDRIIDGIDRSLAALLDQAGLAPGDAIDDTHLVALSAQKAPKWIAPPRHAPRALPTLDALLDTGSRDLADKILRRLGQLETSDRAACLAELGLSGDARGASAIPALRKADPATFEARTGIPLQRVAADLLGTRVRAIAPSEVDAYLRAITDLEHISYEPARRDRTAYLKLVAESKDAVVVLAEDPQGMVGMSFAGPLELFWGTDGPRQDPNLGRGNTLYSADITVSPDARGRGIGWRLRLAQLTEAVRMRKGGKPRYDFISGRNRVGSADAMWAINREFRAYTVAIYHDQYGELGGRARYYRMPLRRHDRRGAPATPRSRVTALSHGIAQPTGATHPLLEHALATGVFDEPALTKLTLSNFITRPMVRWAEAWRTLLPKGMAHLYTTSALDELTDKTIRVLKHNRRAGQLAVGLTGGYFGHTTAACRSLTDFSTFPGPGGRPLAPDAEGFFGWPHVPHPVDGGANRTVAALDALVQKHGAEALIGVFVEAVQARTGSVLSPADWEALCEFRDRTGVPLVLSEHTTALGRSGKGFFWADDQAGTADVVHLWAGGQHGHLFMGDRTFEKKPLAFISTWDGDELSATRLLWQIAAVREHAARGDLAARIAQVDAAVDRLGLDARGQGLYRVIHLAPARLDLLEKRLALAELHIERLLPDRFVFAPPLTIDGRDLDRFFQTLQDVLKQRVPG